jgi:hypothetical protein
MKPILIYSLPRTRGSAALKAAFRTKTYNEPFAIHNIPGVVNISVNNTWERQSQVNDLKVSANIDWDQLQCKLDDPDSATKIHATNLIDCYKARVWYKNVLNENSHDVFIIHRDLKEICISWLMAYYFGFNIWMCHDPYEIEIDERYFDIIRRYIDDFLRFYPTHATSITFDSLPETHFDISRTTQVDQHSDTKLSYIKNLDVTLENIDILIDSFKDQWEDVTGLDIYTLKGLS